MNIIKIPKRKGEFRTIYIPSYEEKRKLKKLMPLLNRLTRKCEHAHGFIQGRSAVTNALRHIGHRYSLSFDLKDFFDTVTPAHVKGKLPADVISQVFIDVHPRQGLPTSPAVANLAAYDLDIRISRLQKKHNLSFVYTRYADDLTFSFDDITVKGVLLAEVPVLVAKFGFVINERKTEFQDASKRRRHVTGIGVDEIGIYPTREAKRKLRAAKHQGNLPQATGLEEWCKLKQPQPRKPRKMSRDQVERAAYSCFVALTLCPEESGIFNSSAFKGNKRDVVRATHKIYRKVQRRLKKKEALQRNKVT